MTLENDLSKARAELTALQDELPQFHGLLTENEADAQRLKKERAPLDAQAQAKGRVGIAKEMLEQHQADIASARAEVEQLEVALNRAQAQAALIRQAELAAHHKANLDAQLAKASKALETHVQSCLEHFDRLSKARAAWGAVDADDDLLQEFRQRGLQLAEGPNPLKPYAFPAPYGGFVWGHVYRKLAARAEAVRKARAEDEAEVRRKRRELEHPPEPKLAMLEIDQRDGYTAAEHLGDLVQSTALQSNGMLSKPDTVIFGVLPEDLEQAQQHLKGVLSFGKYTVKGA